MTFRRETWILCVAIFLGAAGAHAQDQPADPGAVTPDAPLPPLSTGAPDNKAPLPAARGVSPSYEPAAAIPGDAVPDPNTLAGMEPIGAGLLGGAHNVFDPSLIISAGGATVPAANEQSSSFGAAGLIGGALAFSRVGSHSQFNGSYDGAEWLTQGQPSAAFHNLMLSEEMDWYHWRVNLTDIFTYSPEAAFGGAGMGGPGLIGEFASAYTSPLQASLAGSGETFQTGFASRYANNAIGQVEYMFSRRAAFTVSSSYGLLNFVNAGFINSREGSVQAGYDYELDSRNTIAVLGIWGDIAYIGSPSAMRQYTVAAAYGRKITGRLGFEVAAGPQEILALNTPSGNFHMWSPSVRSVLTYELRRTSFSASVNRGLESGGGVFLGANATMAIVSASRQVTRFFTVSVNGGYAFNSNIVPSGVATTNFQNWYFGLSAGRQISQYARIDFNYGLQKQIAPASCPVATCGFEGYQNTLGLTANWRFHPVVE